MCIYTQSLLQHASFSIVYHIFLIQIHLSFFSFLFHFAFSTSFCSMTRPIREKLTILLPRQLNFNQGQLCLLTPAEGAAGGEKARREQQEGRLVKDHTLKAHNAIHSATVICGFAPQNAIEIAFSIFSKQQLSFYKGEEGV